MVNQLETDDIALQMGVDNRSDVKPETARQFVTALYRGLEVLRCFKAGDQFLGNGEISEKTGLPKPTVSRLTYTLSTLGYLNYSKSLRKYKLGTAVLSLGYGLLTNMDILQIARPILQELADYAQAAVGLGVRDRLNMVYLENIYPITSAVVLRHPIGTQISLAKSAMGRAYLCAISESDREYLMEQIRVRDLVNWPRLKAGIEQALKDYQEFGFCLSIGDYLKGINGVAVPIKSPGPGGDVMVINCGAADFQLSRHIIEVDVGPRLIILARQIEQRMGHS